MFKAHLCSCNGPVLNVQLFFASVWGKLISVCIGCVSPERHITESIGLMRQPFQRKAITLKCFISAPFLLVPNRSVTWRSMEASAPGPAGPCAVTLTVGTRGPVCAGLEPVITRPLSAGASCATGSVWRWQIAPGKMFSVTTHLQILLLPLSQSPLNSSTSGQRQRETHTYKDSVSCVLTTLSWRTTELKLTVMMLLRFNLLI